MSTTSQDCQQSLYPDKKAIILGLIEREILEFTLLKYAWIHKPRYQINVLYESAVLLLIGFKDKERQGELYGYYRGLMEQTLAIEINHDEPLKSKLLAEGVYEDLIARKQFLRGIYRQERSMVNKLRLNN
jgi:hypothetical protein